MWWDVGAETVVVLHAHIVKGVTVEVDASIEHVFLINVDMSAVQFLRVL